MLRALAVVAVLTCSTIAVAAAPRPVTRGIWTVPWGMSVSDAQTRLARAGRKPSCDEMRAYFSAPDPPGARPRAHTVEHTSTPMLTVYTPDGSTVVARFDGDHLASVVVSHPVRKSRAAAEADLRVLIAGAGRPTRTDGGVSFWEDRFGVDAVEIEAVDGGGFLLYESRHTTVKP